MTRLEKCFRTIAANRTPAVRGMMFAGTFEVWPGNLVIFYRRTGRGVRILRILHGARDIRRFFE